MWSRHSEEFDERGSTDSYSFNDSLRYTSGGSYEWREDLLGDSRQTESQPSRGRVMVMMPFV